MSILRIKEILASKGMTREQLAQKIKVSRATISNICTENTLPSITLLQLIAKELDVDIRELFNSTKGNVILDMEVNEAKELIQKSLNILNGRIDKP